MPNAASRTWKTDDSAALPPEYWQQTRQNYSFFLKKMPVTLTSYRLYKMLTIFNLFCDDMFISFSWLSFVSN